MILIIFRGAKGHEWTFFNPINRWRGGVFQSPCLGVWMNRLKPGATGQFSVTVKNEHMASAMGNTGVDVLATPMVAMMFEAAATDALKSVMKVDEISVGTWISVYHLKPTPPGMSITTRVTLIESKGVKYLFDVEVHDEVEKVAEGSIERAIIDKDRFYRALNEKVDLAKDIEN